MPVTIPCPDCWPHDESDCTCDTCGRAGRVVSSASSVAALARAVGMRPATVRRWVREGRL